MGSDMTSSHTLPAAAAVDGAPDVVDPHAAHYAKSAGAGRRITDDDQLHEGRHPAPTTDRLALPPLRLGPLTIDVPVVLAPMAGITNTAFRRLCREYGGGLYVNEMVTARALVERKPESMRIIQHDPDEVPRSVQLYSVDPVTTGAAVRMLVEEDRCDHIDMNFGCPVPKVTRRGGGSALPWKSELFASIVKAAVTEAAKKDIPVTVKMRRGIDEDHLTFLDAGRTARFGAAAKRAGANMSSALLAVLEPHGIVEVLVTAVLGTLLGAAIAFLLPYPLALLSLHGAPLTPELLHLPWWIRAAPRVGRPHR